MSDSVRIEFPCDYPIHVIGINDEVLTDTVVTIVRLYAPELTESDVSTNDSSGGKYRSVRLSIRATGEPQLKAMHRHLMSVPLVKMVL